jgi:membrane-associated phospholipid phosphatase
MKTRLVPVILLLNVIFNVTLSLGFAEPPPPEYIQFSPSPTEGALYYPDRVLFPSPHVTFIFIHRKANYLSHPGAVELPKRGFVIGYSIADGAGVCL